MRWKTDEVVKLLSTLGCKIETFPQGGDYDTTNLQLTAKGAAEDQFLHVCGFRCEEYIRKPDDAEIEMVELKDGQDSRGGLHSTDEPTGLLYVKARNLLIGAGFEVVETIDDYF